MKELTFREVIANIKNGEEYKSVFNYSPISHIKCRENGEVIDWTDNDGVNLNTKYIKVRKAVTFEEVLKSNKKCRVEHELIKNIYTSSVVNLCYEASKLKDGECIPFNYLMYILGYCVESNDLKTLIKEGKWYLDEDN